MVVLGGDLVGRRPERQWLADQMSRIGTGTAVVVLGEAGVGKSRLLESGLETAEGAGRRVLRGRALPGPQMPYRIFNEVFASAARRFGIPDDAALGPFRGPLARVVPDWPVTDGGLSDPLLVGEGALRLLRLLGGAEGLVVALEDVHWADPDSLAVVAYLCEHGPGEGLVIAVTIRDDPGPALGGLRALAGRKAASWLRLGPLSANEVAELCRSCAGADLPEPAVRLVTEHADGLPYAVEELVAGLLVSGRLVRDTSGWQTDGRLDPLVPFSVAHSVSQRLADLPADQRRVIDMAAVLGRTFDWQLLVECTDLGDEGAGQALERARVLGILDPGRSGSDLRFRHSLTREAVLGSIPSHLRAGLARSALDRLTVPWTEEHRALAAELTALAGDHHRSSQLRAELAERMAASGALGSAIDGLQQALGTSPGHPDARSWRRRLLALLIASGRLPEAEREAAFLQAHGEVEPVVLGLAEAEAVRHNWGRVAELLAQSGPAARRDAPDRARLLLVQAELAAGRFRPTEADRLVSDALEQAQASGDRRLQGEALIAAARLSQPWSWERSRAQLLEALTLASSNRLRRETALALAGLADLDVLAVVPSDHCEQALIAAYDAGAVSLVASATHNLAMLAALRYRLDDASRWATECVDLARRYRLGWLEAAGLTKHAFVAALSGNESGAETYLTSAETIAGGDPRGLALMHGNVRSAAHLNREDRDLAAVALATASDLAYANRLEPRPYLGLQVLIQAASGRDPESSARRLEHGGLTWPPVVAGLVAAGRAIAAGRAGHTDAAEAHADQAWELLRPTPWHDAIARRYVGEAQARQSWGTKELTLAPAESFFRQASLDRPAAACGMLLRSSPQPGVGARPPVPSHLAALGITRRELDVLELVAEGMTNRQIADYLFLSVRTIDKHVERLMAKTGRPNRAGLAALAARWPHNT
ncbi:MAG TPA: AAA family ATPase [Acidimicrobiales bacterium]|nr:AAA family ATPase [Acidimicrobiales bacterium]